HRQHILRRESWIDVADADQLTNQERTTQDEYARERDLRSGKAVAKTANDKSRGARAAAALQRNRDVRLRGHERRRKTETETSDKAHAEQEQKDAPVKADGHALRQLKRGKTGKRG